MGGAWADNYCSIKAWTAPRLSYLLWTRPMLNIHQIIYSHFISLLWHLLFIVLIHTITHSSELTYYYNYSTKKWPNSDCCVINWSECALFNRRAKLSNCSLQEAKKPPHEGTSLRKLTTFLEAEGRTRRIQEHIRTVKFVVGKECSIDGRWSRCLLANLPESFGGGLSWICSKDGNCNREVVAPKALLLT